MAEPYSESPMYEFSFVQWKNETGIKLTEEQCKAQGIDYKVGKFPMAANGKALILNGVWLCASQERENVLTGSMYVSRGPLPEGQPRAWFP